MTKTQSESPIFSLCFTLWVAFMIGISGYYAMLDYAVRSAL